MPKKHPIRAVTEFERLKPMTWTNKYNLPEPLVSAIARDTYDWTGYVSVTTLIQPPQQVALIKQHKEEIEQDVSDGLWALMGSAIHSVLERARVDNVLREERLYIDIDGIRVTGRPDLYSAEATLSDYKFVSAYSFLLGDKPEWEAQLNCYAAMYRIYGFEVKRAEIVAILRDWSQMRALADREYPQVGVIVKEVPLWPHERVMAYIKGRVAIYKKAIEDGIYEPCTKQERWVRDEAWAVKKKGNKKAMRGGVHDNPDSASMFAAAAGVPTEIEYRPGVSVRCERFCRVSKWCRQYAGMAPMGGNDQENQENMLKPEMPQEERIEGVFKE